MVSPRRARIHHPPGLGTGSAWVERYRRQVYSQGGQDGVIERIFEVMPPRNKWCCEFGAYDGVTYSNTRLLLHEKGWSGLLIEGHPERASKLADLYRDRPDVICVGRPVGATPGVDTLDDMLAEAGAPRDLDFMSIDIDGNDWHVWNSLEHFRPRLVVIEFNRTAPHDFYYVQDNDFALNQSNSLRALIELGKAKGYELIACDRDAYFVTREHFGRFGIPDNSVDLMNTSPPLFHFFQGFDGSMLLVGEPRLVWQGMAFGEEDIQILPAPARKVWWTD